MADILPESTNACPTSPTTDQPELPETQLGHVIGACSEDDGVPDIGVSIGLGEGSMLWLGELLKRDGADIGFVFHGPDGKRIVAPIWPSCEWQDVADLLRHHVAPILARLTSTTPTLGDMVMVPRDVVLEAIRDRRDNGGGSASYQQAYNHIIEAVSILSAAPASPIPTSVNGAGEREDEVDRLAQFLHDEGNFGDAMPDRTWPEHPGDTGQREGGWVKIVPSDVQAHFRDVARRWLLPPVLSPALDNTAVEGWQSPDSAPKDGTVLELAVDYAEGHSPLQDATVACTIGWNDFENTGVDKWHIVGWDWCHDHIRDGAGTIRAWRPSRLMACDDGLPPLPQTVAEDVRNG